MMDPLANTSSPAATHIDLATDGWFKFAIGSLWFCGAMYLLLGLVFGPLGGLQWLAQLDDGAPRDAGIDACFSVVMLVMCGGFGAFNWVVARALQTRAKWGWVAGLVLGGIYAPSGCFPFGIPILYALLRSGVREAYQREGPARR